MGQVVPLFQNTTTGRPARVASSNPLLVPGGIALPILTGLNSATVAGTYGNYHGIDASANDVSFTVPTAAGHQGEILIITLEAVSGGHKLTLTSSQNISSYATGALVTTKQWDTFFLLSNGTQWVLLNLFSVF